jgi:membrane-associated phospholipid phosphatase
VGFDLRVSEGLFVVYLATAIVLAWTRLAPRGRRRAIVIVAVVDLIALVGIAAWPAVRDSAVRDWMPPLHLLVAYRLSGWFFRWPDWRLEAWLLRTDAWVFSRAGLSGFVRRGPRIVLEILEATYASVYALVPIGFLIARLTAHDLDVDRYWTIVAAPVLGAFAMLPWLQSRTPLALGDHIEIETRNLLVRPLNLLIARRASIHVCTIPSGHAAGSTAVALALITVSPWAAVIMAIVAAGIGIGSVTGRYHFAIDVVAGAGLAVLAWLVVATSFPGIR